MKWTLYPLVLASLATIQGFSAPQKLPTHKNFFIEADWLYMRRTEGHTQSIVKREKCGHAGCDETSQITTNALIENFDFEPGYRLTAAMRTSRRGWLEASYLLINPWTATKEAHGNADLLFPFTTKHLVPGFSRADKAVAYETSRWEGAEANYWIYMTPPRGNYFSFAWQAGVRYIRLAEGFSVKFMGNGGDGVYDTSTRNHLYGGQLGADLQMNPLRYMSLDLAAKVAAYWNVSSAATYVGDLEKTLILRDTHAHHDNGAFGLDLAAYLSFYISRYMRIKLGYQMFYVTRVTLAPEQVRKDILSSDGTHIDSNGEALIHGGFAGVSLGF